MNLLKTTAIASSLVAASFVMGTGMAKAQTPDTETATFNTLVPQTCTFGTPDGIGRLVIDGGNPNLLTSAGGTAVTIPLLCNSTSNVNLSVAAPVQTTGAALTPGGAGATSSAAVTAGTATNATPLNIPSVGVLDDDVVVNMAFEADGPILAGTYQFTVNVTATPD